MSEKRTEIEEAATDAVQRTGLHNLSFRTLADQVGVKSSSVHYYFPEKSNLAATLINKYTEDFQKRLDSIDKRKLSPQKKLEAFVGIFESVVKAEKFCLCGMMAAEVATLDDANRDRLTHYFIQAENWLLKIFEDRPHRLNSPLEPLLLARLIMSGLEGAILIDRVEGGVLRLRAQREFVKTLYI